MEGGEAECSLQVLPKSSTDRYPQPNSIHHGTGQVDLLPKIHFQQKKNSGSEGLKLKLRVAGYSGHVDNDIHRSYGCYAQTVSGKRAGKLTHGEKG